MMLRHLQKNPMKTSNNRLLTILVVVLLIANTVTMVLYWMDRKGPRTQNMGPGRGERNVAYLARVLELDSLQQQQLKLLVEEHIGQTKPLRDSMRDMKDAFFDLVQVPEPDSLQADALLTRMGATQKQIDLYTLAHFKKLRAMCSKAQQEKMDGVLKDVLRQIAAPPPPPPPAGPDGRPGQDGPPRDMHDPMPPPPPGH